MLLSFAHVQHASLEKIKSWTGISWAKTADGFIVDMPDELGEAFSKSGMPHTVDGFETFLKERKA